MGKMDGNLRVLCCPVLPDSPKGSEPTPVCPSGARVIKKNMSMEQRRNSAEWKKEVLAENLPQYQFFYH
jgi:hypothetical protein